MADISNDLRLLLSRLSILRKCFAAAMVSLWFLNKESDPASVGVLPMLVGNMAITPATFVNAVLSLPKEEKAEVLKNFALLSLRSALKDSYQAIRTYADKQGVVRELRKTCWFPFLEAVRNSLEHTPLENQVWILPRIKGQPRSVTWHGKTIDEGVKKQPQPMVFSFFGPQDAVSLLAEAEEHFKALALEQHRQSSPQDMPPVRPSPPHKPQ